MPTPLARSLGLTLPIIQAPMSGWTTPELVAAVSEGGGLGMVPATRLSAEQLREMFDRVAGLTRRPFGVNLLAPVVTDLEAARAGGTTILEEARRRFGLPPEPAAPPPMVTPAEGLALALEARVPVVTFAMGCPADLIADARRAKATVMVSVTTVEEALEAERAGADAIVAQGAEAGGHRATFDPASHESLPLVGTMALVPQVVDAVAVPVVAAGGIMDGRGVMAALALGAQAAQLGTRFLLAAESGTTPSYRRRLLEAVETDTVVTEVYTGRPARGLNNEMSRAFARAGETPLPWPQQAVLGNEVYRASYARDGEWAPLLAGQGLRLARREEDARAIVAELAEEAQRVRAALPQW